MAYQIMIDYENLEINVWKEEAQRYAQNADYWRERAERCESNSPRARYVTWSSMHTKHPLAWPWVIYMSIQIYLDKRAQKG